jgi:hypothetical protein
LIGSGWSTYIRQANVEPGSDEANVYVIVVSVVEEPSAGPPVTVVSGGVASIAKLRLTTAEGWPTLSNACTEKVWVPPARFDVEYDDALEHVTGAPSIRHWTPWMPLPAPSPAENVHVCVLPGPNVWLLGPPVIVTVGLVLSTRNVRAVDGEDVV